MSVDSDGTERIGFLDDWKIIITRRIRKTFSSVFLSVFFLPFTRFVCLCDYRLRRHGLIITTVSLSGVIEKEEEEEWKDESTWISGLFIPILILSLGFPSFAIIPIFLSFPFLSVRLLYLSTAKKRSSISIKSQGKGREGKGGNFIPFIHGKGPVVDMMCMPCLVFFYNLSAMKY